MERRTLALIIGAVAIGACITCAILGWIISSSPTLKATPTALAIARKTEATKPTNTPAPTNTPKPTGTFAPTESVTPSPTDTSKPTNTPERTATPVPTASTVAARRFSKLEVIQVEYADGKVNISGETDLPDGSILSITFDVAGRPSTATYIGVNTRVAVKEGKFSAELIPPNRPEFAQGPYLVEVLFTPRAQTDNVLKIVGNNGENLDGARETAGFRTLETSKPVSLELNVVPYPMVSPASYPRDSPERAVAEYLEAWQKADWNRMATFTSKTWQDGQSDAAGLLEAQYGFKDLLGATIEGNTPQSDLMVDIGVTVYYALGSEIRTRTLTARVIRESAPYTPSTSGDWGVNPLSTLREE